MIFDKYTSVLTADHRNLYDLNDPEKFPILEIRRNPHTKLWAVFHKFGADGEWEEMTAWGTSCMGEPATLVKLRTRFKFIAKWRMLTEIERIYLRDSKYRCDNVFIA